jgi:hypothetical protein
MGDEIERKMRALTDEIRNSTKPKTPDGNSAVGNGNLVNSGTIIVRSASAPIRSVRAARDSFKPLLLDAIRERAVKLAITEAQLLEEASRALRRPLIARLESLNERQLGLVYSVIAHRKRPALE